MNKITLNGPICIEEAASLFLDIIQNKYGEEEREHLKNLQLKRTFTIQNTVRIKNEIKYTWDGSNKYTFYYKL